MGNKIIPIIIDKETISDDFYTIVELFFENGDEIRKGDIILAFETSKALVEVESPSPGYVHYNVEEGQEVAVGDISAAVSDSFDIPVDYFDGFSPVEQKSVRATDSAGDDAVGIRVSRAAKKLLKEHNLELSIFKGKTILRTSDIHEYLKSNTADTSRMEEERFQSQNKIIIVGGGGHAKMCIDIIRQMKTYNLVGIVDFNLEIDPATLDVPVIGGKEELEKLFEGGVNFAVIGFGALHKPIIRQEIYHKLKRIGYVLPNLIHPSATLEPSSKLGEGNQIMAGAVIGSDVRVGNNCIINSGSIVSHESILHDNVHITPGAILAGKVKVGGNTIIGMGVTVLVSVNIGSNVTISNGMNIVKDVSNGLVLKNKSSQLE